MMNKLILVLFLMLDCCMSDTEIRTEKNDEINQWKQLYCRDGEVIIVGNTWNSGNYFVCVPNSLVEKINEQRQ